MLNAISVFVGGACGGYTLISMLSLVLNSKSLGDSGFTAAGLLVAMAIATVVVAAVTRVASLAALVFLTRGTFALEWVRPSDCVSFDSWVMCSWNFFGRNGRQEGLRFIGLGIALQGDHDKSIINALASATP